MVSLGCCIFKRRQNVVFFEERVILEDLLMGCPRTKQGQDICDTNALTANAGAPAAFPRFNGDSVSQTRFHGNPRVVGSYASMTFIILISNMFLPPVTQQSFA